jgi:hypothetical protein
MGRCHVTHTEVGLEAERDWTLDLDTTTETMPRECRDGTSERCGPCGFLQYRIPSQKASSLTPSCLDLRRG